MLSAHSNDVVDQAAAEQDVSQGRHDQRHGDDHDAHACGAAAPGAGCSERWCTAMGTANCSFKFTCMSRVSLVNLGKL